MRWSVQSIAWVCCLLTACGDDGGGTPPPPVDAGPGADGAVLDPPMPRAPELVGACPPGWRMVDDELAVCEPWPEGGALDCGPGEAHFPGEPGCVALGAACPAGDFPDDLPTDVTVVYVRQGAAGGDGSASLPFATVAEGLSTARAGDVVVVAAGTYDEVLRPRAGITLRGACVERTTLTSSESSVVEGVVNANRTGVVQVRDLGIADAARSAVAVGGSAEVVLSGVRASGATALAFNVGGRLRADGVAIRETVPRPSDSMGGLGLFCQRGGVELERAVLERNTGGSVATMTDCDVSMVGVALRATLPNPGTGLGGRALQHGGAGIIDVAASVVEDNADFGILIIGDGASVALSDTVIRRTAATGDDPTGRGLEVNGLGTVVVERTAFSDNVEVGLTTGGGASLTARDLVILRTGPRESDGTLGRAMTIQHGSTATVERARLHASHEAALTINDMGTRADFTDLEITGTLERACAVDTCADESLGIAFGVFRDASASMMRFALRDAPLCGVQIALDAALDLSDGEVSGSAVGACIQVDDYDIERLRRRVLYRDNGINLDATMLPVPESS